jgi:hypothetical protein
MGDLLGREERGSEVDVIILERILSFLAEQVFQ